MTRAGVENKGVFASISIDPPPPSTRPNVTTSSPHPSGSSSAVGLASTTAVDVGVHLPGEVFLEAASAEATVRHEQR